MDKGEMMAVRLPHFDRLPRAVAIDLDGTLLNSRTELSSHNRGALERCLAAGIPVIIATSRPARIFNRIFPLELAECCSRVIMNGAIARGNPPLSGYFKESLSEETASDIIDFARQFDPGIRITIELDGYEFGASWQADAATLWQKNSATPDMLLSIEEALTKQPCKIALSSQTRNILEFGETLAKTMGDSISVVPALLSYHMLNITARHATKPSALKRLLNPVSISLQEVLAFGDDIPDMEMLIACGISVAMGNAFPGVKSACAYLTASNDEDGVALVLEEMLRNTE